MAQHNAKSIAKELVSDVRIQLHLVANHAVCMALINLVTLYKVQTIRSIGMGVRPKLLEKHIKKPCCD